MVKYRLTVTAACIVSSVSMASPTAYAQFDSEDAPADPELGGGFDRLAELRAAANTVVDFRPAAFSVAVAASLSGHMKSYELIDTSLADIQQNSEHINSLQLRNKTLASEKQRLAS